MDDGASKRVSPRTPVVVLNMHYSGLGIARNLEHLGASVYGLSSDESFPGNRSKHCTYLRCPDTERQPAACRDFLLAFAERLGDRPILLPTRDHDIEFILRFRGDLESAYVIPYPASEIVGGMLDKSRLFGIARQTGIRCPKDRVVRSMTELDACRAPIGFPCMVKPLRSTDWRRNDVWDLVGRRKAVKIDSWEELKRFYARLEGRAREIHVQELVPGPDNNLVVFGSYFNPRSDLVRYFTARKVIQYPAQSGTGVVVRSEPIPAIVQPSLSLLKGLGYHGVSEIEYKFDDRRGEYVLIEVNPRHWDQHRLGAVSGVNLTIALCRDLAGENVPVEYQRSSPVTWVAEEGYLYSLLSNFKRREYPLALYASALRGRKTFAVADVRDAAPTWRLAAHLVRLQATVFRSILKRRRAA